ncbi:MAG: hypothetical protein ACXVB9_06175 [Bdellovibrionota bacterium]
MPFRNQFWIVAAGVVVGICVVRLAGPKRSVHVPLRYDPMEKPVSAASGPVYPMIRARSLVLGDDSLVLGLSDAGEPGLWMKGNHGGVMQMGVRGDGFPFLRVSDELVRNSGSAQVEGAAASPILAFRHEGEVKLIFGLDMTHPEHEPFLAYWGGDGKKRMLIGDYCNDASRICSK